MGVETYKFYLHYSISLLIIIIYKKIYFVTSFSPQKKKKTCDQEICSRLYGLQVLKRKTETTKGENF